VVLEEGKEEECFLAFQNTFNNDGAIAPSP
jgi:hypothetical protein